MIHENNRRQFLGNASVLGAAALTSALPLIAHSQQAEHVFKFSHGEPADSSMGKSADFFASALAKRSNGRIKVDVFASGQLAGGGDIRLELERVQLGVIDITSSAGTLYFTTFDPRFNIVQLPYLFRDDAAYLRYIRTAPTAQAMLSAVEKQGFKALTFWPRPYRQLTNSKRSIRTPADMKGLKVRLPPVEILTDSFSAFGASPVAMAYGELYTAMQNGTVDGQDNAVELMWSSKFYEVQKFLTRIDYARDALMPSMNKRKFDALAPDLQKAVLDAAIDAAAFRLEYDRSNEERFQGLLKEKGVEITLLSAAEKEAFRAASRPVYEKWSRKLGKPFFDQVIAEANL